ARLADGHVPRARPRAPRPRGAAAARAGGRDRARRGAAQPALPGRRRAAGRPGAALPPWQDARGGRHDRRRACAAARVRTLVAAPERRGEGGAVGEVLLWSCQPAARLGEPHTTGQLVGSWEVVPPSPGDACLRAYRAMV